MRYFAVGIWIFLGWGFLNLPVVTLAAPARTTDKVGWSFSQKPELLKEMHRIQERHHERLSKMESQIRSKLGTAQNIQIGSKNQQLDHLTRDLNQLQVLMADLNRKRDFLDRLSQILQTQWYGQSINEFLTAQLLEMATNELKNTEKTGDSLTLFTTYLSIALRELKDPQENIFDFINGYIEASAVINPTPPQEFLKTRHYTNGVSTAQAKGVSKERLGEEVEKFIKAKDESPQVLRTTADK